MNQEKPVRSGFLLCPPVGKIVLKKSWQQKYCVLFNSSKLGIERLEIYDNIDDYSKNSAPKIYSLKNCVKITQKDATMFTVTAKTWNQTFGTTNSEELIEWLNALQSVAFKDDTSKTMSMVEDNDLYCSSGEGVFSVKLSPSEASRKCGLEPKTYTLLITTTALQLQDSYDSNILFTWPYHYIRRYGYRDNKFTFEAGRKCDSGEGSFHLEHSNEQEIFRCLSSKMKSMRKFLNGESNVSTPVLDCGDNQFHAALSMEARSRSPLPPSPTSSTRLKDVDSSKPNIASSKLPVSFGDSLTKINFLPNSSTHPTSNQIKPKPIKPPRKNLPFKHDSDITIPVYEPINTESSQLINNYDKVEYRKEAWKTMGIEDVNHMEHYDSDNDELPEYESWKLSKSQESLNLNLVPVPSASKIIPQFDHLTCNTYDNYDQLQFFGSTAKTTSTNPGYKKITPTQVLYSSDKNLTSYGEYEEVKNEVDNMEPVRLADDSHRGYGIIRKLTQVKPNEITVSNNTKPKIQHVSFSDNEIPHQVINDTTYAVISKPKRV